MDISMAQPATDSDPDMNEALRRVREHDKRGGTR